MLGTMLMVALVGGAETPAQYGCGCYGGAGAVVYGGGYRMAAPVYGGYGAGVGYGGGCYGVGAPVYGGGYGAGVGYGGGCYGYGAPVYGGHRPAAPIYGGGCYGYGGGTIISGGYTQPGTIICGCQGGVIIGGPIVGMPPVIDKGKTIDKGKDKDQDAELTDAEKATWKKYLDSLEAADRKTAETAWNDAKTNADKRALVRQAAEQLKKAGGNEQSSAIRRRESVDA